MAKVDAKIKRDKHAKKILSKKTKQKRKHQMYVTQATELLGSMDSAKKGSKTTSNSKPTSNSKTKSVTKSPEALNDSSCSFGVPQNKNVTGLFTTPAKVMRSFVTPNDKPNHICTDCGCGADDCHEVKYRNYCLHSVLDYFDEVGMGYVTQHGIYSAFLRAYTVALKKDMLESTKYYELNVDCELPDCMERGSLEDAQQIHRCNRLWQSLMTKRVHDVGSYIEDLKAGRITAPFCHDVEG